MEYMIFDDLCNIALICLLMGVGAAIFFAVIFLYIAGYSILEDWND